MKNNFNRGLIAVSVVLAGVVFCVQMKYPGYSRAAYAISIGYLAAELLAVLFLLYKDKAAKTEIKAYSMSIVVFLLGELPIVYRYRNAESSLQSGVTGYVQALTLMIIVSSVLFVIVRKLNHRKI